MFFEARNFDAQYPYEIEDDWGGKIIVDIEDIKELYEFTKNYLEMVKQIEEYKKM